MSTKLHATAAALDCAYILATTNAGDNPNMLGFMRRVDGSMLYRVGPNGSRQNDATQAEMNKALAAMILAARVERW